MTPAEFAQLTRAEQIAYLTNTYGGTIEDRQRAAGGNNALVSPKFRAHNIATADYVSPEERQLWSLVKKDGGTWLGNALHEAAPYALAAGLAATGYSALSGAGAAGGAAAAAPEAGSGLGIFANGGTAGLAGVGGGNAGALAASGGIAGGAGIGGTTAGALGGASGLVNSVSGAGTTAGGGMGWNWGDIINTGGQLLGGYLESRGSRDAANTAAAGSQAAVDESHRQFDLSRSDQMPWLQAGTAALGRLNDPNAFTASPGYAFQREEGTRDIGNSFAARGGALSGNALKRLTEFNSGLAAQDYGNWWNRQAGLAGVGQASAQNLGALGANSAANVGNALQTGANARASGILGQTNSYVGTLSDLLKKYDEKRNPYGWGG